MANNLEWKNYRAKQRAKRTDNQKGAATGGTLTNILQTEEVVVQRLSSEVSGKAQKYSRIGARDFVPFTFSEVTLEACDCHIDIRYSTLGHWRHIRDTFAANSGRKSSGEITVSAPSCVDV